MCNSHGGRLRSADAHFIYHFMYMLSRVELYNVSNGAAKVPRSISAWQKANKIPHYINTGAKILQMMIPTACAMLLARKIVYIGRFRN